MPDLPQSSGGNQGADRQLELAVTHCMQSWFPVNPAVLQQVQEGVASNRYKVNRLELLNDLKKDSALFTWSIKRLIENGSLLSDAASPDDVLKNAEWSELEVVLGSRESEISSHRLSDMSELQGARLKSALISSSAAEVLASKQNLEPQLGYSCATFRQLGLLLISWNYPHVYKRAVSTLKPKDKLEAVLGKILGFSPTLLGLTIARKLGFPSTLRIGMGDTYAREEAQESEISTHTADTLDRICKIGEALARAADPEHYPSAKLDWNEARSQIEGMLGPDGMRQIRAKLEKNCEFYAQTMPDVFRFPKDFAPVTTVTPSKASGGRSLFAHNTYCKHCPERIQESLQGLYETIDGNTIAKSNIDKLTKEVIPTAGFARGCIYLIEPDSLMLVPRLAIGDTSLNHFKSVMYNAGSSSFDPIVAAFRCQYPIMEDRAEVGGQNVSYVAGAMGDHQKAGVLYLEISEEMLRDRDSNVLLIYKALRQTLNDCLGLR
ncbi:MAG: hypothetical protein K1X83_05070 [Oligoflexia bacterium]|nr:hypothetical protein [Oligoflexia bacterium]